MMLVLDASMALSWIFARPIALLRIARQYDLSAYDASYLELALRLSAPLATFDRKLAGAARAAGGAVFT